MNKCPLLLKYRIRICFSGVEFDFNPETEEKTGEEIRRHRKEDDRYEVWKLLPPRKEQDSFASRNISSDSHYSRYELYAVGDPNPVVVYFHEIVRNSYHDIRLCCLPDDYIANFLSNGEYDNSFASCITPIVYEYERNRGDWQTSFVVYLR